MTLLILPLAAVTVTPLLGLTSWCPLPGLMCSWARAAAAEALAALCEAAGVLGAGDPLEQAAISRPAAAVAAVIASRRPGPPLLPWGLSCCAAGRPPCRSAALPILLFADHTLLVLAFPAFSG